MQWRLVHGQSDLSGRLFLGKPGVEADAFCRRSAGDADVPGTVARHGLSDAVRYARRVNDERRQSSKPLWWVGAKEPNCTGRHRRRLL